MSLTSLDCALKQSVSEFRAGFPISPPTVISISTFGTTSVTNIIGRSSLFPITHALGLITLSPVATLTAISLLPEDLLLSPHCVAALIIPLASSRVICSHTAGFGLGKADLGAQLKLFDLEANIDTEALRLCFTNLSSRELRCDAALCASAVDVAG